MEPVPAITWMKTLTYERQSGYTLECTVFLVSHFQHIGMATIYIYICCYKLTKQFHSGDINFVAGSEDYNLDLKIGKVYEYGWSSTHSLQLG